jgi:oligoendopeptidase F
LERELPDATALENWLVDYSELSAVVSEYAAWRNIEHACHTDDPEIEKAYLHWVEMVSPAIQPYGDKLARKYLASPGRSALEQGDVRFRMLGRSWEAGVEIFRDANISLLTEVTKLNAAYDKRIGAMQVEYEGKTYTLQQLARFQEETDRAVREATWKLSTSRRLQDRDEIDGLFEQMLEKRAAIAKNAGLSDYRAYVWKSFERFDYAPADCEGFNDAIEKVVVPKVAELDRQRKEALSVESLRPWDLSVDIKGRGPLRPFEQDDVEALVRGGREVFGKVSPVLAEQFGKLKQGRNLDLVSRKGKRAGGFQSSLAECKEPFIFMNAAGVHRDVDTLLHEGGHAFHFQWASENEPLTFLTHAPLEFCEVASMSMELLGCDHYDVFYSDDGQAMRAKRHQLEGIVRFFPWMATIDAFQHWLYTHPGHTRTQRYEAWLATLERFSSSVVDWAGLEEARQARWHAQLHVFHYPFYYVEYGIAQLGSLQLWQNYQRDPRKTLQQYQQALSLGGTRPLPELFSAAGIRFDFSEKTLAPLMDALMQELATLPA